jgi:hypothetical protein
VGHTSNLRVPHEADEAYARAPPAKRRIGERSKRRTISTPPSGMRSSKATAKTPTSWKRLVMLDLLIFPLMIA